MGSATEWSRRRTCASPGLGASWSTRCSQGAAFPPRPLPTAPSSLASDAPSTSWRVVPSIERSVDDRRVLHGRRRSRRGRHGSPRRGLHVVDADSAHRPCVSRPAGRGPGDERHLAVRALPRRALRARRGRGGDLLRHLRLVLLRPPVRLLRSLGPRLRPLRSPARPHLGHAGRHLRHSRARLLALVLVGRPLPLPQRPPQWQRACGSVAKLPTVRFFAPPEPGPGSALAFPRPRTLC